MIAWWLLGASLATLVGVAVWCKRLKDQLARQEAETTRLTQKLSLVRRELAEVNARRKKLLSASTQALIIVEKDYEISSANKVAKRLFGKLGKESSLMAWTRQHQLQELVDQTLQGEKMPPLYFHRGERTLEAHARSIKERKQAVAVALAIHDVTELQQLARARRDFVANISHELRTPLASIQLLTETLLNNGVEDKEMACMLITKIATQVDTLSQLAQEVLDLTSIESGKVLLRMASYPLEPIVSAQLRRLTTQAERKNISLTVDIPDDVTVLVDETMVGRVFSNLVHNAIKFTETGGVTISAARLDSDSTKNGHPPQPEQNGDEWVTVRVADTGIGIPTDELGRVFERFYKIDRARNRQQSGTGLGLAIAKHIVEAHGGQIWVEHNNPGAVFRFTLPTE